MKQQNSSYLWQTSCNGHVSWRIWTFLRGWMSFSAFSLRTLKKTQKNPKQTSSSSVRGTLTTKFKHQGFQLSLSKFSQQHIIKYYWRKHSKFCLKYVNTWFFFCPISFLPHFQSNVIWKGRYSYSRSKANPSLWLENNNSAAFREYLQNQSLRNMWKIVGNKILNPTEQKEKAGRRENPTGFSFLTLHKIPLFGHKLVHLCKETERWPSFSVPEAS